MPVYWAPRCNTKNGSAFAKYVFVQQTANQNAHELTIANPYLFMVCMVYTGALQWRIQDFGVVGHTCTEAGYIGLFHSPKSS